MAFMDEEDRGSCGAHAPAAMHTDCACSWCLQGLVPVGNDV
jgi:hypothetical protein